MNNELITVIIPVYNVEKYLGKCIDSIVKQTYKNIEIILINDGSTDESGKICDEYAEKYNNISVVHKENQGISATRNLGIDMAKGKYICFFDSDDYIDKYMIEKLYKECIENDAQIACCGKAIENNDKTTIINANNNFCVSGKEALKKLFLIDDIDSSCCDKLFDISLFKDIRYPINRKYEDLAILYKLLDKANKVAHIKLPGYHYIIRQDSFTNVKFDSRHLDLLYYSKEIRNYIYNKYSDLKEVVDCYYYLQIATLLQKIRYSSNFKENKEKYKEIKKEYNKDILKILKNKHIPKTKKIMCVLIYLNCFNILKVMKKIIKK